MPIEGLEGLSLSHRPFVPLPPICSDSTVHSEETMSHQSNRPGHLSPEHLSDEDTKSTESIFLTQVPGYPCPCLVLSSQRLLYHHCVAGLLQVARSKHRAGLETRRKHPWQDLQARLGDLLSQGLRWGYPKGQVRPCGTDSIWGLAGAWF